MTSHVLCKLALLTCHAALSVVGISCRNMLQSIAIQGWHQIGANVCMGFEFPQPLDCFWLFKLKKTLAFSLRLWKQAVLRKIDYRPDPQFSLLLRFFSISFSFFSSSRRASTSSWSWRHLWKFSTTTPTNMFSTKKLTMSRKEIKYNSIQGLWLRSGYGHEGQEEKGQIHHMTNKEGHPIL